MAITKQKEKTITEIIKEKNRFLKAGKWQRAF